MTRERNKIFELSSQLKDCAEQAKARETELQAHVDRLKEALFNVIEYADNIKLHSEDKHVLHFVECIQSWRNTLDQSPVQSLAKHDAEVIREMIKWASHEREGLSSYSLKIIDEYADNLERAGDE